MARKRRDAWGSITEMERNRRYVIRYWASTDERGYMRHSVTVHGTRADAERKRAELMLDHSKDAPCPTVRQVWERWALPSYQRRAESGDLSQTTLRQFTSVWANHIAPRWADVPCDQVRPLQVQQWIDGMSLSVARTATSVMSVLMDFAVRYETIDHNPMRERYLMPPRSTTERRDDGVWTLDELGEIWRSVHGMWLEPAFLLMAFGGLRVGESLGVRSEDVVEAVVDGMRLAMVSVERQVPNHGKEAVDRLKTPQSRRVVPIPGRAGARLLSIAATTDGWLSGDGMGSANSQRRLNATWRRIDMEQRHPIHNLRNSWQTNMRWTMRVPPWAIEVIMGHSVAGITGQFYDRPDSTMLAQMVAEAYARQPYDVGWTWATWDILGYSHT